MSEIVSGDNLVVIVLTSKIEYRVVLEALELYADQEDPKSRIHINVALDLIGALNG